MTLPADLLVSLPIVEDSQSDAPPPPQEETATKPAALGFALSFVAGRGVLSLENVTAGPVIVKRLELAIPNISFPFDVSGGAVGFKHHRCELRRLVLGLRAQTVREMVEKADLDTVGIADFKFTVHDGFCQISGQINVGGSQAYFTQKVCAIPSSPRDLSLVFYDTRVYGWLPIPAPFITDLLKRALEGEMLRSTSIEVWALQPVEQFVREFLPKHGWKVPNTEHAPLIDASMARGRVFVVAGSSSLVSEKKQQEAASPREALKALEGVSILSVAESALSRGKLADALALFKDAYEDGRAAAFASRRLLQLGVTDPEWFSETAHLAQTLIESDELIFESHLALASIAIHRQAWEDAHEHLQQMRAAVGADESRADKAAWDLCAAHVASHLSTEVALAAYERAVKSARESKSAYAALFDLRQTAEDFEGAMEAGRRWLRLTKAPEHKIDIHLKIGRLCLYHRDDLRGARYHFERATRIDPDHPGALEGLAESLLVQNDVSKAISVYRQLAEQTEQPAEKVRLNIKLGDLWAEKLGDLEAAVARYQFAVDTAPRHAAARLKLAQLLVAQDQLRGAQLQYLDLIAVAEEEAPRDDALLMQAYEELGDVYERIGAPLDDQIDALTRACRLAPDNAVLRERCAAVLAKANRWDEANHHLQQALDLTTGEQAQMRIRLTAAQIFAHGMHDLHAARAQLEEILSVSPDHDEALGQIRSVLLRQADYVSLAEHFRIAARATDDAAKKARYLFTEYQAISKLGLPFQEQMGLLEQATTCDPAFAPAIDALVQALEVQGDASRLHSALELQLSAATSDDKKIGTLLRLGQVRWRDTDDFKGAKKALEQVIELQANHSLAWITLSRVIEEHGDAKAAYEALAASLEHEHEQEAAVQERLGELALSLQRSIEARAHLEQAIELGLRSEVLCGDWIKLMVEEGRQDQAAETLLAWARDESWPQPDHLRLIAGDLFRAAGNFERAAQIYEALVSGGSEVSVSAVSGLEQIAEASGDAGLAITALRTMLPRADGPHREGILEHLLAHEAGAGNDDAAMSLAKELLEDQPSSAAALSYLAQRALGREDFAGALGFARTFFEAPPPAADDVFVQRMLELALNLDPDLAARIEQWAQRAGVSVSRRSLARRFREEGRTMSLEALRRLEIEGGTASAEAYEDLGNLLGDTLAGTGFLRQAYILDPTRRDVRETLAERFAENIGAMVEFSLQVVHQDPDESVRVRFGLIALEKLQTFDEARYRELLRDFATQDIFVGEPAMLDHLRVLNDAPALARALRASLDQDPRPDDGRFEELMELYEVLGERSHALALCEALAKQNPQSDLPFRAWTQVLEDSPDDARAVYEQWLQGREGAARASVLVGMGDYLASQELLPAAIAAWSEALQSAPVKNQILEKLVDAAASRGEMLQAAYWQAQIPGNEAARKLVQIAHALGDARTELDALARVTPRTAEEDRRYAVCAARLGRFDVVEALAMGPGDWPAQARLDAARLYFSHAEREKAHALLDLALAEGQGSAAWALDASFAKTPQEKRALANRRMEAADQWFGRPAWRLLGLSELVELGDAKLEDRLREGLEKSEIQDAASAASAYKLAEVLAEPYWLDTTAAVLIRFLPQDDGQVPELLENRIGFALGQSRPADAAALAEQLQQLDARRARPWLERAYHEAGKKRELLELWRADPSSEGPRWDLIELELDVGDVDAARTRLFSIDDDARSENWSALLLRAAEHTGDEDRVAAWTHQARLESDEAKKAGLLHDAAVAAESFDADRAVSLAKEAARLDARFEQHFEDALRRLARHQALVEHLEAKASSQSGQDAGATLWRAVEIARDDLLDVPLAFSLAERAIESDATYLSPAFELAATLGDATRARAFGEQSFAREASREDAEFLRRYLALVKDDDVRALQVRQALEALGEASLEDQLAMAQALSASQPEKAVALYESLAIHDADHGADHALAAAKLHQQVGSNERALQVAMSAMKQGHQEPALDEVAWSLAKDRSAVAGLILARQTLGTFSGEEQFRILLSGAIAAAASGDQPSALRRLEEAGAHRQDAEWMAAKEHVLEELGAKDELATFWMEHLEKASWTSEEKGERVAEARRIFESYGLSAREQEAIDWLVANGADAEMFNERRLAIAHDTRDAEGYVRTLNGRILSADELDVHTQALTEKFDRADLALQLVRAQLDKSPSEKAATMFVDLMVLDGRASEGIGTLLSIIGDASSEEALGVLRVAARLGDSYGDEQAYGAYLAILKHDPLDEEALRVCRRHFTRTKRHGPHVELILGAASHSDAEPKRKLLWEAADLAKATIDDPALHGRILQDILALGEDDEASTRLLEALIVQNDWPAARDVFEKHTIKVDRQFVLGLALVDGLRLSGDIEAARSVLEILCEADPNNTRLRGHKLALARAANDSSGLLKELEGELREAATRRGALREVLTYNPAEVGPKLVARFEEERDWQGVVDVRVVWAESVPPSEQAQQLYEAAGGGPG